MAYSELIKDFSRIREYMRQFYVYGFRTRDEYDGKSARSYDNERRRIESWLGEYMSFRQDSTGKVTFISVDSRSIIHNPLYRAFKAKSFTDNDITLHFYILDILREHGVLSVSEITERICSDYLSHFDDVQLPDESTVRKKLKEYVGAGILQSRKSGRRVVYSLREDHAELASWQDALDFFTETAPTGVIGSFILDKCEHTSDIFSFKHHYILHVLESDITCSLLEAISDRCEVTLDISSRRSRRVLKHRILPARIFMSTQDGRGYVLAKDIKDGRFNMYRLDNIKKVAFSGKTDEDMESFEEQAEDFMKYLWNTSSGDGETVNTEHLEMILKLGPENDHILGRLRREGRHGEITDLGGGRLRYSIDVYDAAEMKPWIRTFTGRIESLSCSNEAVTESLYSDLEAMYEMYGGEEDAVQ